MSIYENCISSDNCNNEPIKTSREKLMRYMKKDNKRSYIKHKKITNENIARAMIVLIDNGIEEDEADTVLQAIGYTLLDEELFPDSINMEEVYKKINEIRKEE